MPADGRSVLRKYRAAPSCMRIRLRFDAPVTAMRLNVRKRFLFQPTQRIRAARAIGETDFTRGSAGILVEPFAESTQSK